MTTQALQILLRRITVAAPIAALLAACSAPQSVRPSQPEASSAFRAGLSTVTATRHMAASANPLATEAGREILRAGGSAVDAARRPGVVFAVASTPRAGRRSGMPGSASTSTYRN